MMSHPIIAGETDIEEERYMVDRRIKISCIGTSIQLSKDKTVVPISLNAEENQWIVNHDGTHCESPELEEAIKMAEIIIMR